MKKKPAKVAEPATNYGVKKSTKPSAGSKLADGSESTFNSARQIRYATPEQVRKATEKVFRVHHELFRKLAQ